MLRLCKALGVSVRPNADRAGLARTHAALPLAAADLSLTEVPATDARAFWTWNGISRPFRNRNLSGGTIRIGTREFAKGLCGHTPFSNIYRLDGLADEFRAEIGVEANDHEKDPSL